MSIDEKQKTLKTIENYEKLILELLGRVKWSGELGDKFNPKNEQFDEINEQIEKYKTSIRALKIQQLEKDDNKIYLSEIIEKEKPEFGSNNLILAPVGSGKTTLINKLIKEKEGKILMLVSNTALKNSVSPDDDDIKRKRGDRKYTTQNKNVYGDKNVEIHVMSYAEFGMRIRFTNEFVEDVYQIFCDEIHSLPTYQSINNSAGLAVAEKFLFCKQKGIEIFYFTATDESLVKLRKKNPYVMKDVEKFDYRNYPNIKKYMALSEYKINHITQIRPHIKARKESFDYFGHKALCYSKTIKGLKAISNIAEEEGLKPLTLWSVNSQYENQELSKEQLEARDILLTTGIIPEPYNFLAINSSMLEGWNLIDPSVKLAIMNTTNPTEYIQALGRIRKDVDILVFRTNEKEELTVDIIIPENYVDVMLLTDDKKKLCKELGIVNANGKVASWRTVKKLLQNDGSMYWLESGTDYDDKGKKFRYDVIRKLKDEE